MQAQARVSILAVLRHFPCVPLCDDRSRCISLHPSVVPAQIAFVDFNPEGALAQPHTVDAPADELVRAQD